MIDAGDRFLRAEVLHQLERDTEGRRLYASLAERRRTSCPGSRRRSSGCADRGGTRRLRRSGEPWTPLRHAVVGV
jgi:hypothetical protein